MKKLLFLMLAILMIPLNISFAEENSAPLTFIESMDNSKNLDSYSAVQYMKGVFDISEKTDGQKAKGDYMISFVSDVTQKKGVANAIQTSVKGNINIAVDGKEKNFNKASIGFRMDVKVFDTTNIYVRVNDISITAEGVDKEHLSDYSDMQKQLAEAMTAIKGKWYFFPNKIAKELGMNNNSKSLSPLMDTKKLSAKLAKEGASAYIKEMISEMMDASVKSGYLTKAEALKAKVMIYNFVTNGLFTKNTIGSAECKGCVKYSLNKTGITDFIKKISGIVKEEPADSDLQEITEFLGKTEFSVTAKQSADNKIFDTIKMNLQIKNMEPVNLITFDYVSKTTNINKAKKIKVPEKFESIEKLAGQLDLGSF